jgi:hypothetical protein
MREEQNRHHRVFHSQPHSKDHVARWSAARIHGEIVSMTNKTTAQERAEASFKKKAVQLVEGQKAMVEYEANAALVRERTARLRAVRLAREAAQGS